MGGDADSITVSGFSSGAGMASAMHVIHSDTFKGVGILAGGSFTGMLNYYEPYEDSDGTYESLRELWADGYDQTYLDDAMNEVFQKGYIDDPSNLQNAPVYIDQGANDLFGTTSTESAKSFYEILQSDVKFRETDRNHVISTDFSDKDVEDCNGSKFNLFLIERGIVNCDSDMAGIMFEHLFSNLPTSVSLNPMNSDSRNWETKGVLREFSQTEFLPDDLGLFDFSGLDDYGYVYYPNTCIGQSGCKVHMMLHGCASGRENLFDLVPRKSGWL